LPDMIVFTLGKDTVIALTSEGNKNKRIEAAMANVVHGRTLDAERLACFKLRIATKQIIESHVQKGRSASVFLLERSFNTTIMIQVLKKVPNLKFHPSIRFA